MAWLNKFQEGGAVSAQDQAMQQLVALVQAAMQGNAEAQQQIQQIMAAAQQGDQQAQQLAAAIQQIAQELQGQAQMAKKGAILDYIHNLRCGGKNAMKKKVQKKSAGGCNCKKLLRKGGRLINVDCNE